MKKTQPFAEAPISENNSFNRIGGKKCVVLNNFFVKLAQNGKSNYLFHTKNVFMKRCRQALLPYTTMIPNVDEWNCSWLCFCFCLQLKRSFKKKSDQNDQIALNI